MCAICQALAQPIRYSKNSFGVEEMHVAVQDECEKSNGENESNVVVDKLTTEVVEKAAPGSDSDLVIKNLATEVVEKSVPGNDSDILANLATEVVKKDTPDNDSDIFAGLNGVKTAVEAVTAAGESQQNITSVIKEQEKEDKVDQKKEQPVSSDAGDAAKAGSETPQEPATVVANGVSCDVNDDIEEEDIVDEDDVVDELSPSSQFTDAKEEQSPVTQPSSISEVESKEPAPVAEPLRKDSQTEAVVSNEAKSPATIEQNGTPANEISEKMETDIEEVAEQKSLVSEEDSAAAVVGDNDKMETEETKSETSPETVPAPVASATAELSPSPAATVEKAPESVTVPKDSSLEKKPHLPVIVRDKPCAVVAATNFGVAENVDDKMDTTDAEPVIKINDDQNAKPTLVDEFKPAVEIKPVESVEKDVTPVTIIKPVEDPVPVPVPETKIEKKPAEPEKEPAAKETATVASVKRKATADTAEGPEQDRDGGISSSSSHSSSSEADNTQDCKRIRFDESIFEEDERERLIREFVDRSTETSDEIGKNCDKLQHEIAALSDLARAKELEWNSIMRLLKLKEEMLERILFKKRHIDCQNKPEMEVNVNKMYKNFVTSSTTSTDQKSNRSETSTPTNINNHVSVVPIGSSISAASAAAAASASATSGNASSNLSNAATAPQDLYNSGSGKSSSAINSSLATESLGSKLRPQHRPILPKPPVTSASQAAAAQSSSHVSHTLHAAVQQAAAAAAAQQAMAQPPHSSSSSSQQQHMQQQHQAQSNMMQSNAASLLVDQNSIIGEGRQGPILDVKSIIADFRSKNPDSLPRRGRRNLPFGVRGISDNGPGPRFLGNTSLLSMANIALGSGSHIRTSVTSTTHNDHRPNSFMMGQDNSVPTSLTRTEMQMRHPTIDSLMLSVNQAAAAAAASGNSSQPNSSTNSSGNSNSNNDYFRETLVKIAKLNEKRSEMSNTAALHMGGNNKGGGGSHLPPPPPYPEVTLHPVLVPQSSGSPPVQNSLLHGILTKSNAAAAAAAAQAASNQHHPSSTVGNAGSMGATSVSSIQHRPTTFSPTLARLLTAPERSRGHRTTIGSSGRNTKSTLNEILNSKKTRTEVTITPVTTSTAGPTKNGSDVVLDDDDESEVADRLVIDEGREVVAESASNVIPADQVPECQGCHKKAAQFVCAGCGNQWYCSRECQVEAWENHSEMCSG